MNYQLFFPKSYAHNRTFSNTIRFCCIVGVIQLLVFITALLTQTPVHAQASGQSGSGVSIYIPAVKNQSIEHVTPQVEWTFHKSTDSLHPDGNEQQLLWLTNRARANPTQEGIWLATSDDKEFAGDRDFFGVNKALLQEEFASYPAMPPAAFDIRLYNAAKAHCDDLIGRDAQDHNNQFERVRAAGFSMGRARGSIFSYAKSPLNTHAAWNIDWGPGADGMQSGRGHRMGIMALDGNYTNAGIAVVAEDNPNTQVGPYVATANYAEAADKPDHYNQFIVGTVWNDDNGNQQYDPGEGVGGVTVRPASGGFYAVTAESGGYAIPVEENGEYMVTFSRAGSSNIVHTITVQDGSVLLDVEEWQ
ncbi:MAG: hypothetical protein R3A44_35150 [Caldilineaceae bacterium]